MNTLSVYDAPGGQSSFGNMDELTDNIPGIDCIVLTQRVEDVFLPIFATQWTSTTTAPMRSGWPDPGDAVYTVLQAVGLRALAPRRARGRWVARWR